MSSEAQCREVTTGLWAPLGSTMPEQCFSGFYCPGARDDIVNVVPGSRPIILAAGDATETVNEQVVTETVTSSVSTNLTLEADLDSLNATELRMQLAAHGYAAGCNAHLAPGVVHCAKLPRRTRRRPRARSWPRSRRSGRRLPLGSRPCLRSL